MGCHNGLGSVVADEGVQMAVDACNGRVASHLEVPAAGFAVVGQGVYVVELGLELGETSVVVNLQKRTAVPYRGSADNGHTRGGNLGPDLRVWACGGGGVVLLQPRARPGVSRWWG